MLLLLLPLEMATRMEVEKGMFVLKKMVSAHDSLLGLKRDLRGLTQTKRKVLLPHAWDRHGKQFITLAGDITTLSRFTRLVSGHAPTGEYHQWFFPDEPHGCTCFQHFQTRSHLLVECPKYSSKVSSMIAFNLANNNVHTILKFLKKNPSAFTFEDEPIDIYDTP